MVATANAHGERNVAVLFCGPTAMEAATRKACAVCSSTKGGGEKEEKRRKRKKKEKGFSRCIPRPSHCKRTNTVHAVHLLNSTFTSKYRSFPCGMYPCIWQAYDDPGEHIAVGFKMLLCWSYPSLAFVKLPARANRTTAIWHGCHHIHETSCFVCYH